MPTIVQNLGPVTAYGYAKAAGYTGSEADFTALLGDLAETVSDLESLSVSVTTLAPGSSATASYADGVLSLGIPRGDKGDTGNTGATGAAAGFGAVSATVDANIGTPSVEVSSSGPDTAKAFAFAFHNLKGMQGDPGVSPAVTVTEITGGHQITITDADHPSGQTFDVMDGESVQIDSTLSIAGAAADAKAAGDAISELKSQINNSITPYITDNMTAPAALSVGDYVMANNTLYRVIAPIANGATITPNTNVVATTEADELKRKANTGGNYPDMTVGNAEQLVATVGIEDKVPYNFRTSGGSADIGDREVDTVVGGTLVWNQLVNHGNFDATTGFTTTNASFSVSGNVGTITPTAKSGGINKNTAFTSGHKYLMTCDIKSDGISVFYGGASITITVNGNTAYTTAALIASKSSTGTDSFPRVRGSASNETISDIYVKNMMVFDLTLMFGSAIADYIYSLEQANAGAGVAWFRKLFPKDYYSCDTGTLMSVKTSAHNMVGFNAYDNTTGKAKLVGGMQYQITGAYTALSYSTGETLTPDSDGYFTPTANGELTVTGGNGTTTCVHLVWDGSRDGEYAPYEAHTYPLDSSLELRGVPRLDADNKLYYDGDTYASDGTVTRRAVLVTYDGSEDEAWAQSTAITAPNPDRRVFVIKIGVMNSAISGVFISNVWQAANTSSTSSAVGMNIINSSTYNRAQLVVRPENVSTMTVAQFRTLLSANPLTVVYLLADAYATTESADPYQNPQILDDFGTEEYVDAAVVASTRDVAIPVGHDTYYQANLRAKLEMAPDSPDGDGDYLVRQSSGQNTYVPLVLPLDELPAAPDTDGTYVLKVTVASGEATYTWVSE